MVDLKNKDASERMEAGEFQSFNLNMLKKEREPKHTCHFLCKRKRITSGLISISIPVILYQNCLEGYFQPLKQLDCQQRMLDPYMYMYYSKINNNGNKWQLIHSGVTNVKMPYCSPKYEFSMTASIRMTPFHLTFRTPLSSLNSLQWPSRPSLCLMQVVKLR